MSTYQPNAQFHEAVKLLEATQDPDHQKAATAKIQQLGATEAFQNALMAIMLHGGRHGVPVDVRQSAGLSIKNNLRRYTANQRATAKRLSLLLLNEPDHTIRGLAGTMIAHIVRTEGLDSWPELAPDLVAKLRNTKNVAAAAGSLETLFKIVEDTGDLIMTAGGGHSKGYGDVITTLLIAYLRHPTSKCRVLALKVFMVRCVSAHSATYLNSTTVICSCCISSTSLTILHARPCDVPGRYWCISNPSRSTSISQKLWGDWQNCAPIPTSRFKLNSSRHCPASLTCMSNIRFSRKAPRSHQSANTCYALSFMPMKT